MSYFPDVFPLLSQSRRYVWERSMWAILLTLATITTLHYLTDVHLIPYHSMYRSLYYIPIAIAAVRYGWRGGLLSAGATIVLYIPHVLLSWNTMPGNGINNVLEMVLFICVGVFAGSLADGERRQRQRAEESAQQLVIANTRLQEQAALAERTRAQVASILESIDSCVITTDTDCQLTAANQAATKLFPALLPSGGPLPDLLTSYAKGGARGYQQLQLGKQTFGLHGSPLRGANGEVLGTVLVLDDLTDVRNLEEQVQRTQRLAALGRLAGGLAHEIRNPLGIVRASAQLLHTELHGDLHLGEYTAIIQTEVDRVDRLIEQLLEYARPRPVKRGRVNLQFLAEQAIGLMRAFAGQHGVSISTLIESELPYIEGDSELIHQALINVLMNAVQATPAGGEVHLEIHANPLGEPPGVWLLIRDTGRGIPPNDLPRIFDPFFSTRDGGVGLGLSIVQQIVQDHRGTIAVSSDLGGGSVFSVYLPSDAITESALAL